MVRRWRRASERDRRLRGRVTRRVVPTTRHRTRSQVQKRLRGFAAWGWSATIIHPLIALSIAWVAFLQPGVAPAAVSPSEFWTWISRSGSSGSAFATLALTAGVVVPLFLATQLGGAVREGSDEEADGHAIALEMLTNIACLTGSVIGWLVFPAAVSGGGNGLVNGMGAASVPMLFSWLWALTRPSVESRRLASERVRADCSTLFRLIDEFDASLRSGGGRALGLGEPTLPLWRGVALEGVVCGVVIGAVFAVHRLFVMGVDLWPRAIGDVVGFALIFTCVHFFCAWVAIENQMERLFRGRWSVFIERVPYLGLLLLFVLSGASLVLSGEVRVGLAMWALFCGPVALARARKWTRLRQALVYLRVRARGHAIIRSCRAARPRVLVTAMWRRQRPVLAGAGVEHSSGSETVTLRSGERERVLVGEARP